MNILNVIPSLEIRAGGPTQSVYLLSVELKRKEVDVQLITIESVQNEVIGRDDYIHYVPVCKKGYFSFLHFLESFTPQLFHIQCLWHPTMHAGACYARKMHIPYVVSTRGMLYPAALKVSSWKKVLGWCFYQKQDLNKATVVHATCRQEMEHNRQKGITVPIAVIPNAIPVVKGIVQPIYTGKRRIGFIGRLHQIKNIDVLIKAWAMVDTKKCELVLIGDGSTDYVAFLKKLTADLHITNIIFAGFLQGEKKQQTIATLQYLILPSHSENFGMVVPEALIQGIPVIASKGTPWEELNTHRCGWWVDNDVETLTATIQTALATPEEERIAMGERGKRLIQENYTVEIVAGKMKRLYEWILEGGEKPEFVYLK